VDRASALIERLRLAPHPEGGHYAQVFRSPTTIDPRDGRSVRAALTAIYFLLRAGEVSRWHRVASDEVWCHLEGAPIELHQADEGTRRVTSSRLAAVSADTQPQCTVPAGIWQAACSTGEYSLAACFVAPGFDFADFALVHTGDALHDWIAREHPPLTRFL
jgi:uncharacterized protein